jgi:hypothetical protein
VKALAEAALGTDRRVFALGARANRPHLDLEPFGVPCEWLPAEDHPELCEQYLALNRAKFPDLPLERWVLSDVYLLPGAIVGVMDRDDRILSAWVGLPSVVRHERIGVSLLSVAPGMGAWAKAFGARVHRARSLRGVARWASKSLRTHVRMGPLRVLGPVPGGRDDGAFAYATDLDDGTWEAAMAGQLDWPVLRRVRADDRIATDGILEAAAAGEPVRIVPPGLDGGWVTLG